ncbi:hypothetical protein E2562_020772 [Oryza meyeriana var. granulata]|uniref:Uncharacterized protein n=1 Tax=Oryza meyeriana var. granulata TaxID=110450 RepID=A0A6G1CHD4_9ORYZ|nr:hypothetical protein E2562_020772 [Oryza meyeriana var. granulata]
MRMRWEMKIDIASQLGHLAVATATVMMLVASAPVMALEKEAREATEARLLPRAWELRFNHQIGERRLRGTRIIVTRPKQCFASQANAALKRDEQLLMF